jgi:glutathione S-transferase kappa 1
MVGAHGIINPIRHIKKMAAAAGKKLKITLFFDTVSPYSLYCWAVLLRYKTRWNLELDLKPVFLGGIMSATQNRPPATLPARARFQMEDVQRNNGLFGVDILPSPGNFFSEAARSVLSVQRMLVGRMLDGANQEDMERIVTKCFEAIHVDKAFRTEDNNLILNDDTILKALKAAGMSETAARQALKRGADADVKKALADNTKEAVDAGAYGSPTMLIHGGRAPYYNGTDPLFVFGSDRFEQIAFVCGLPYLGVNPDAAGKSKM